MKRLILCLSLSLLMVSGVVASGITRTGVIPTGVTMLSKAFVCTSLDTITTGETYTITITNLQRYAQNQSFYFDLTDVSGSANSVTITAYGKVVSSGSWVQIGTPITWTSNSNDGYITSTSPINYNYFKLELVADGSTQKNLLAAFDVKTSNAFEIPASSGTLTISRQDAGTVTITCADDNANAALTITPGGNGALVLGNGTGTGAVNTSDWDVSATGDLTGIGAITNNGLITASAGATITGAAINLNASSNFVVNVGTGSTNAAVTIGGGSNAIAVDGTTIGVKGAINQAIAGGTVVTSAGLLGGGGTSTSATQTLGAAGGKAFSYYLSSTSTTASDVLTGYYMNVNYGTSGASAAPSGDVIRGRAWLVGDASGTSALTGGAFSVELAATTASNTGLTAGMRGNLVLPDGVLTNAGTYYGSMAEIYLGGAATDTRSYTTISPLGIVISGTAATSAAQLSNMVAMDISVPSNMVTSDGTLVVTGATGAVAAGLKIKINGTDYWIMLANADE